jgi:hypothetical protein
MKPTSGSRRMVVLGTHHVQGDDEDVRTLPGRIGGKGMGSGLLVDIAECRVNCRRLSALRDILGNRGCGRCAQTDRAEKASPIHVCGVHAEFETSKSTKDTQAESA